MTINTSFKMKAKEIRTSFLKYFEKHGHSVEPSASLVPINDPSLMFTNAGMVPFKNYFTGAQAAPFKRAASSQKCVRAGGKHNDLENVGYTARHHTFFEMLGNFSFGDYFKEDAIEFAWGLITKEFGIEKEKLYVTVYHEDDEAFGLWKKIGGLPDSRIIRIDTKDNFWSMGETGPCGPCSEIFYDHGSMYEGGLPGSLDQDGDRYIEIWNLVFMQYEDLPSGERIKLPKPSIDTGMGLERISAVLQGKNNNFEIDLFQSLIKHSKMITGNDEDSSSHKVIADHIRAMSFLVADGVMASNEGRGYVLRRIMRRAMRHAYHLGVRSPALYKLVRPLVDEMGEAYPELERAKHIIESAIASEEQKFLKTLDHGMKILDDEIKQLHSSSKLGGGVAFKLYDTYGFPLDMTTDILRTQNISVDLDGFEKAMQEQKERARASWVGSGQASTNKIWYDIASRIGSTEFLGYASNRGQGVVQAIVQNGASTDLVSEGEAIVILNQTPFYGESGGQVGDTGVLGGNVVVDTRKYEGLHGHHIIVEHEIRVGQIVECAIDVERRMEIKRNHSATHLLHKALRRIIGEHVVQKGSWVGPDRLRFDFAHGKALTREEISAVEEWVNEAILNNLRTEIKLEEFEEAVKQGAMALFGEKYSKEVRVVTMGDSIELCGGTHVNSSGDIGAFIVTSEEAVGSGVRRIEALTGKRAYNFFAERANILLRLAGGLKCNIDDVESRVESLIRDNKELNKTVLKQQLQIASFIPVEKEEYKFCTLYVKHLSECGQDVLRSVLSDLYTKYKSKSLIVVSSTVGGKVTVLINASEDILHTIDAKFLSEQVAGALGGSGGGRAQQAQVGGNDVTKLCDAITLIKTILRGRE